MSRVGHVLLGALVVACLAACTGAPPASAPSVPATADRGSTPSDDQGGSDRKPVDQPGVGTGAQPGGEPLPAATPVDCPPGGTTVGTADQLKGALAAAVIAMLVIWRWAWPSSFARWVTRPARGRGGDGGTDAAGPPF